MVLAEIPKHLETIKLCSADRAANNYRRAVKLGWTVSAEAAESSPINLCSLRSVCYRWVNSKCTS